MSAFASLGSMPCTLMSEMPLWSMAFGKSISPMRWPIMNTALQSTAQASAISSTIRMAGILCLRSAARMGWMSMTVLSNRFQLRRGRHRAGAPRGQDACNQAGDQRDHERRKEHGDVEVRETRVLCRLVANRPQAEFGKEQPQHAAGNADHAGLHHELREYRRTRCAQCTTHADLARTTQAFRQQQAHRVDDADQQEPERES